MTKQMLHIRKIRVLARGGGTRVGWVLSDDEGDLQVAGHGGVSPTRQLCVDEARARMADDDGYKGYDG